MTKLSEDIALLWSCWARKELLRCRAEREQADHDLLRADWLDLDRMLLAAEAFCSRESGETFVLVTRTGQALTF